MHELNSTMISAYEGKKYADNYRYCLTFS